MGVLKSIFCLINDFLCFIFGEGSWRLRHHERIVLEAAISSLDEAIQIPLHAQLKQRMFIQRSHAQIIHPHFYSSWYIPNRNAIEDGDLSHKLVVVQIDVAGKKQNAHVEFFRGRIDSIQLKQPGKYYLGKEIKVKDVKPGNPSLSHAAAIDRLEHGKLDRDF